MKPIFLCVLSFLTYFNVTVAQITPSHVVIVILENKSYNQIVGSADAPYINSLISNSHAALFTRSFGLTHPSQPNYIMLYSGSAQGVIDNSIPSNLPFTTPNLGAEVIKKGLSFIGYSEGLPSVGSTIESSGSYRRKHNPWVNWQGTAANGVPASSNRPYTDFPSNYNLLPTVCFVIPNQADDMHDGTIAAGDAWVKTHLDAYARWSINNNSLFILTFDEDDRSSANQVLTMFVGADIKRGSYNQPITHYNVLRTIEQLYKLPYAGKSADSSAIKGIWLSAFPVTYQFIGNGNWTYASNWLNSLVPPGNATIGSEIIINPVNGGQCVLNTSYTIPAGTSLKVLSGKKLTVKGKLIIK